MGLSLDDQQKLTDILQHVDPETPIDTLWPLQIKLMALQTRLLNDLVEAADALAHELTKMGRHPQL